MIYHNLPANLCVNRVCYNAYGEWRSVPGFSPDHLLVSHQGYVRTRRSVKDLGPPHKGTTNVDFYQRVNVDSKLWYVHQLVLRAFVGEAPSDGHSGDHIDRNHSNNDVRNLRWATKAEQRANQEREPQYNNVDGWVVETQDDLAADPHYVDATGKPVPQPAEEWCAAKYYGQPVPGWRVSNRGRAQCRHQNTVNDLWKKPFTPKANRQKPYPRIASWMGLHTVVYSSFHELEHGKSVDHIDRNGANCMLSNLRAATPREQCLNRTLGDKSKRADSQKVPTMACKKGEQGDPDKCVLYPTQDAAAKACLVHPSEVSDVVSGRNGRRSAKGFVFWSAEDSTPWTEDFGYHVEDEFDRSDDDSEPSAKRLKA